MQPTNERLLGEALMEGGRLALTERESLAILVALSPRPGRGERGFEWGDEDG
jgi:hypothetical protein